MPRYIEHLREQAAGRGSTAGADARAKLGEAQADLAATKAALLRGELVPVAEVEAFWRSKLRAFRNNVLAVPGRVRHLAPQQSETITQELRKALTELAG